jgi:hypothetical protein
VTAALVAIVIVAVIVVILLAASVRVLREYERGVIFRLGRLLSPPKGPGLIFLIPIIDKMVRVDLRTVTLNVPPQEVITKDNVPVRVNAVAYFRIIEPTNAIVQVENFMVATSQIAQTTSSTSPPPRGESRSRSSRSRTSRSRAACSVRWRDRRRPSASAAGRSSRPRASSRPRSVSRTPPT